MKKLLIGRWGDDNIRTRHQNAPHRVLVRLLQAAVPSNALL